MLPMVKREGGGDLVPISELLSYRLSRTSSALSRSAALRYRREFDVSLGEWRAIALIAADPTLTLNRLARRAGLDKAQVSRVVRGLVERGLVGRTEGSGRSRQLALTEAGVTAYRGLIAAANERDATFAEVLSGEEARVLGRALEKLTDLALSLERRERDRLDDA
ncbi:MarR family winged helix-turn-helix transcriptional regulator [Streptomyces sp. NEAU-YJ-81]|uniref:MarR family winged helix-turn-helix transcriptional regulator n=1 Tax=Streptomyces sp. NEAU-YJ-81 TaxID=2820288 RepID=UPI001ABBE772|nr:MarR family transcriptional regulator [Streptomyces sp. NEAU-YJ-81]MBO3682219.1 MarR family transcriptional regulator [Streptomyces sp. NEAU-YJ-81]